MDSILVEEHVTLICELGCVRVREVIRALQQGDTTPETQNLSPTERMQILYQLQSIMAVYDTRH
jgi:hypothetical protein